MKTIFNIITFGAVVLASLNCHAQIEYQESFADGATGWTGSGFETTAVADCSGNGAIRARVNREIGDTLRVEAVSGSLGVSDGTELAIQYSIKLLAYDAVLPQHALPNADFGRVIIETSPSLTGPWAVADRIDVSNYAPTTECIVRTVNFVPPTGDRVYLRFRAELGTAINTDYYVYIDEITALQGVLAQGNIIPDGALASAYINPGDNYLHIEYTAPVDEWGLFNMQGQQVTVRDIDGNGTRLDISGLAFGNYMIKLRSADRIETLNIIKN